MPERAETTEVLKADALVIYRRERSPAWQCRFKVDKRWYRKSTGETDEEKARQKAWELYHGYRFQHEQGLPIVSKSFKDFARLASERMEKEIANGTGRSVFKEHIGIIRNYLIPALGNKQIDRIDSEALTHLDELRREKMGRTPAKSTIQSHNAALQKVFTEAVNRGYLSESDRPQLPTNGETGKRRPDFTREELGPMLDALKEHSTQGRNTSESKHRRLLLQDYVHFLLSTGVRPGKEVINLTWGQIRLSTDEIPDQSTRHWCDQTKDFIFVPQKRTVVQFSVTHWKTKRSSETRIVVGFEDTYQALLRIARRNYREKYALLPHLSVAIKDEDIASDYVFRIPEQDQPVKGIDDNWDRFIQKNNLEICPRSGEKRTLYSLRHTYITLKLIDSVSIHTVSRQVGSSVETISNHYSHLDAYIARHQLATNTSTTALSSLYTPPLNEDQEDPCEPPRDDM